MKTTFGFLKYALLCVAMFAFAACSNDDDDADNGGSGEIVIAEDLKTIACTGSDNDSKSITFTAKNDWTAIASHSWIDLSKRTGSAGDNTIIITIEDNDDFKTRIGTVTIKDKVSGKSIDIIITQGEKGSVFTITGTDGNSKSQGGTLIINNESQVITDTILVASNYDYTVKTDAAWLTYEKISDNGSTKYVFHANPAKLYADTKYQEKTTKVSFEYVAATRAPAILTYDVKFAGITPVAKFYQTGNTTAAAELMDNNGVYVAAITVESNVKWTLNNASDYSTVEFSGDNNSVDYFTSTNFVTVSLKEGKLDTDDLNTGKFELLGTDGKSFASLPVVIKGVGNDYIYIDRSNFKPSLSETSGFYMFAAESENPLELNFDVKAANFDDVKFYVASVETNYGIPFIDLATEMQQWSLWAGVDKYVPLSRTAIETGKYTLWLQSRNSSEAMMGGNPYSNRFLAVFAVSATAYPTFDDMFEGEWPDLRLKGSLENNYVMVGQKGLIPSFSFESTTIPADNTVLTVPLTGGDIKIENIETDGVGCSFWTNVIWNNTEDHFDWTGDYGSDILTTNYDNFDGMNGEIVITVPASTSARSFVCGFSSFIDGKEIEYLMRTFTIKQE